jgi:hypothetical protein
MNALRQADDSLVRAAARWLERLRAKWVPVRGKKARQDKNLELRF